MAPPNDPNAVAAADDAPSFSKQLESATIKIIVGTGDLSKKEFSVHLDVICRKAPKFDELLKDSSPRGYKEFLHLPRDSSVVFGLFMTWLYQDVIEKPGGTAYWTCWILVVYASFAEKYNISELADRIMDFLVRFSKDNGGVPQNIAAVYELTRPGSRIRRFVAKWMAYKTLTCSNSDGGRYTDNVFCTALKSHKDFALDYIRELRMQSGVKMVDPRNLPACTFHGHGKDEPCVIASKKRKRDEGDE